MKAGIKYSFIRTENAKVYIILEKYSKESNNSNKYDQNSYNISTSKHVGDFLKAVNRQFFNIRKIYFDK